MTNPATREHARRMYIDGHTQKQIADFLTVNPRTVFDWIREGDWKRARAAATSAPIIIADKYYNQLAVMGEAIENREERPYATKEEADIIRKLTMSVKQLKGSTSSTVSETVQFCMLFSNFLQKRAPNLSPQVIDIMDQFVNSVMPGKQTYLKTVADERELRHDYDQYLNNLAKPQQEETRPKVEAQNNKDESLRAQRSNLASTDVKQTGPFPGPENDKDESLGHRHFSPAGAGNLASTQDEQTEYHSTPSACEIARPALPFGRASSLAMTKPGRQTVNLLQINQITPTTLTIKPEESGSKVEAQNNKDVSPGHGPFSPAHAGNLASTRDEQTDTHSAPFACEIARPALPFGRASSLAMTELEKTGSLSGCIHGKIPGALSWPSRIPLPPIAWNYQFTGIFEISEDTTPIPQPQSSTSVRSLEDARQAEREKYFGFTIEQCNHFMDLIQHAIVFHKDAQDGLTTQALERGLFAASQNDNGITSCLDVFGVPYPLRYKLLWLMHDNGVGYRIPAAA